MEPEFYSGQRVVCAEIPPIFVMLWPDGSPVVLPCIGQTYTVRHVEACEECIFHLTLVGMDPDHHFPCAWFKEADEPKEMSVLRGVIDPGAKKILRGRSI